MLKRLRWQLTLLYALAALSLVAVVTVGSYALLGYYYQYTTDLALQYKMAEAFQQYGLSVPAELANAQENWLTQGAVPLLNPIQSAERNETQSMNEDKKEGEDGEEPHSGEDSARDGDSDEHYDGQLASVFILPLTNSGSTWPSQASLSLPFQPNQAAFRAALENGHDWRTVELAGGSRLRLFTYRTGNREGLAVFQVGRLLDDQDRLLGLFLAGLMLLGIVVFVFLSLGGWLLSGRTIAPAQKAWDQQQAFVSNASHELRTPLTILRATAELHLRLPEESSPAEGFQSIIEECDYMNCLVDDLLLLSRLDARRLVFDRQPIRLDEFLREIQEQTLPLASKKGVSLSLGKAEGTIFGDSVRMRQILLILIDNALRHTPLGGMVQLDARMQGERVIICVTDNGIGVPAEHLPHLFERFYQVPSKDFGEGKSNGLGLSIAKGFIEAQRGHIQLQSQEGKGTKVSLVF